jgi:hypothetical protein
MVSIGYRPVVTGGTIESGCVVLQELKELEGKTCFVIKTSDLNMERLFVGKRIPSTRPLQHARILSDLVRLRDEAVAAVAAASDINPNQALDDLGLDEQQSKKRKKASIVEGQIASVTVQDVDGTNLSVRMFAFNKKTPLYVELKEENIARLRRVVSNQISGAGEPRVQKTKNASTSVNKGIIWNEKGQLYRVLYVVDGKTKQKSVCVTEERTKEETLQAAIDFRNEHCEVNGQH